jgi:signal peptidase I
MNRKVLGIELGAVAGHPAARFALSAMIGLNVVALSVAMVFWSSELSAGGLAFGVFLLVVFFVPAFAVACNWRWGYTYAQYVAGLSVVGALVAIFRSSTTGLDDPALKLGALFGFGFNAAVLSLATLARPKPPVRVEEAGEKPRKATDPLEWTRDNVEAIVVAFLMALIIRCYCLEVFKIPTGSMEPTLYGDTKKEDMPPHHVGDRIMVDKVGLLLNDVDRFEVCVFRYPLDRSRNFIKRIVGLPGDDLAIEHGDLWVRPSGTREPFRIARKPAREQVGIWLTAWPGEDVGSAACRKKWDGAAAACYLGGNAYDTAPAKGNAVFRFQDRVKDSYKTHGSLLNVYDLCVRFRATFAEGAGELYVIHSRGDGYGTFTTTLSAGGVLKFERLPDRDSTFEPASAAPAPASVGAISAGTEVEVAMFDGALRVRLAGREAASWEYANELPDRLRAPDAPPFQIQFGSRGGAVRFENLWLGRDIHYYLKGSTCFDGRDFLTIPRDKYFAIGDNVGNSKDGRLWKYRIVELTNGERIFGDYDSAEHYPQNKVKVGDRYRMRDLNGTDHFFTREEIESESESEWLPFVSREELVGKALLVWWPLPRFKVIR